jgi:site-specific recombinase XerD
MYVRDPAKVKVYGPLQPYAAGLCVELGRLGYTPKSAAEVMQLVAHLSRWMQYRDLTPVEFTAEVVARFLADRRKRYRKRLTGRSLLPVLGYLRRIGVVPDEPDPDQDSETGKLVEAYRRYLLHERGLATGSVRRYLLAVCVFLAGVETPLGEGLQRVTAAQVTQFVRDQAGCRSVADAKGMVTALRSLLRFLFMTGKIARPLAMAVPTVANRKLSALPGRLQPGQAELLLQACDRGSVGGRRDYAILLLLMRLGLRAGEVSSIRTGDIDWRAGILSVRGKGGLQDRLPLPPDVGQALVDYLQHGRFNPCAARQLFVARRPPRQGISATTVRITVARASKRAGLPRIGAHRLRHTLASDLLSAGASLAEIGQVLRHRSQLSTAIYAKVDRTRLAALAQPWPAGAS